MGVQAPTGGMDFNQMMQLQQQMHAKNMQDSAQQAMFNNQVNKDLEMMSAINKLIEKGSETRKQLIQSMGGR